MVRLDEAWHGEMRSGGASYGGYGMVRRGEARCVLVGRVTAVTVCHGLTRHGRVGVGWASYGGCG